MSRRSGPSGEFHRMPNPTEARIALESARQMPGIEDLAGGGVDVERLAAELPPGLRRAS